MKINKLLLLSHAFLLTFATLSTSTTFLFTSKVAEEGNFAVLATAGVAGSEVVVEEGGSAAGRAAVTTAAAGLPPLTVPPPFWGMLTVEGG